jgi:8-oxo-dGTP diphosphatase
MKIKISKKMKDYLKKHPYTEPDGLQESQGKKAVSFDFDDTLALSYMDADSGQYVYTGPHKEMVTRMKKFINHPSYLVYVVTSRFEEEEKDVHEKHPEGKKIKDFLNENKLIVDGVFFTDGALKIDKLKELKVFLHHDDDPEEINAIRSGGIEAIVSDPYGDYEKMKTTLKEKNDINKKVAKVVMYDGNKILILKRAEEKNSWDLPGGHLEEGESTEEGAVRETKEETNLDIKELQHVSKDKRITFYTCGRPNGKIKLQKEEHTDYKWIESSDLEDYNMKEILKKAVRKAKKINEDFQQSVKKGHRKMKIRLIGKGGNDYVIKGMEKPSYTRAKSAAAGFGGLEEKKM